jgi:hypothetical protein
MGFLDVNSLEGIQVITNQEGPLAPAELEMLEWNIPILKPNGKLEPPDIEYEHMLEVMAAAKRQSGRLITDLDELARIARTHHQWAEKPAINQEDASGPNLGT